MPWRPTLVRTHEGSRLTRISLGHPLVDEYLSFTGVRVRPNTWLAVASDLKVFFAAIGNEPASVSTADIFRFIESQRADRLGPKVVRLEDGERGLSARTIKRRLASVSGFYAYLVARGDVGVLTNPVPRGLSTRRPAARAGRWAPPLIGTPRTLPRVLSPTEVDGLLHALRTRRDRAMVEAMLLGGLRGCEVLGLRLRDVWPGERQLFLAEGKGGHQRVVPISQRFFTTLSDYLSVERPQTDTDRVFLVLKGARRGQALSAYGLEEIISGARGRAGLRPLTCHQLRHTCLTRLRQAGMPLEAVQAQAGHRSIESTRVYLQLADHWVAEQYLRAVTAIDAGSGGIES